MSKKFNIHDWQAKQRLNESDRFGFASGTNIIPDKTDSDGRNTWGDKVGYADNQIEDKIAEYIDHTFASWMSPGNPDFSKEYAKGSPYFDKLMKGIMGILPASMSDKDPRRDPAIRSDFDDPVMDEGWIGNSSFKTRSLIGGKDQEVFIDKANTLDDVTIRWRGTNHWGNKTFEHLEFTFSEEIEDHQNKGKEESWIAKSEDEQWVFMVDVYKVHQEANPEPMWETLEVDEVVGTYEVEPELDEQNTLAANSGNSVTTGDGMGYMSPNAFKKKKNKLNEEEEEDDEKDSKTSPEEKPEEEKPEEVKFSRDVELVLRYIDRINYKSEWLELFDFVVDLEITNLKPAQKVLILRTKASTITK